MKKITTTRKPNRRPARESKNPKGVKNQLFKRRSNAGSRKSKDILMNNTLEQPIVETTKTAEATEKPKVEFTRGQLGKAKRAFTKAGQAESSEEVRKKWLAEMSAAGVVVTKFSSSCLAKAIKGDVTVDDLRK